MDQQTLQENREREWVRRLFEQKGIAPLDVRSLKCPAPDVGVQLSDGRRLAIEVTEVLSGEHTRRHARKKEIQQAPGGIDAIFTRPASALDVACRIEAKMGKDYHVPHGHQLQLLLAAGTVEHGGGSTSLLLYLSVQELNQLTHDMLERSRYQHAYLHLQLGSGLYEWTRRDGWREIHTPGLDRALETEMRQAGR
ncbi:hypothetical protein [Chromobacterium violaceum]|uniref:Uncharacterized protein n=1 Tax=Chromobacterium violaceum TaxID=536 RepID=A0AAX2MDL2_CHRVL|nr:hypothetical protein [Chromobacterium violaceum]OLZ86190.1 hypothetical protein BS642_02240 [Chromobacterium violaceum]STB70077.1 Uncharacterised protein [Chromobacterium violaceum]SUX34691.1 Uncharacterised protein [Chromobacterium violaceum]